MTAFSDWSRLESIEAAVAWHRDPENAPLANVWHTDTIADLASELRRLLELAQSDERLIALLWHHVPGDDRIEIANSLEAPGNRYPGCSERLSSILNTPA